MERTLTLEDIQGRDLPGLLREVARGQDTLRIVLGDGEAVSLQPAAPDSAGEPRVPKSLPQLPGFVPPGWKDAIY